MIECIPVDRLPVLVVVSAGIAGAAHEYAGAASTILRRLVLRAVGISSTVTAIMATIEYARTL